MFIKSTTPWLSPIRAHLGPWACCLPNGQSEILSEEPSTKYQVRNCHLKRLQFAMKRKDAGWVVPHGIVQVFLLRHALHLICAKLELGWPGFRCQPLLARHEGQQRWSPSLRFRPTLGWVGGRATSLEETEWRMPPKQVMRGFWKGGSALVLRKLPQEQIDQENRPKTLSCDARVLRV